MNIQVYIKLKNLTERKKIVLLATKIDTMLPISNNFFNLRYIFNFLFFNRIIAIFKGHTIRKVYGVPNGSIKLDLFYKNEMTRHALVLNPLSMVRLFP